MGKHVNSQGKMGMMLAKGGKTPSKKPSLPPKVLARPAAPAPVKQPSLPPEAPMGRQPTIPGRDAMAEGRPFKKGGKC
jgi:hypothetical protein